MKQHVEDTELQARASKRLMAAVINLALNDACIPPLAGEKGRGNRNGMARISVPISRNAFTAMRFLFDTSVAGLNEYLMWLDIDPEQYRNKLFTTMYNESALPVAGFEPIKRRHFKQNYKMWLSIHRGLAPISFDPDSMDEE